MRLLRHARADRHLWGDVAALVLTAVVLTVLVRPIPWVAASRSAAQSR